MEIFQAALQILSVIVLSVILSVMALRVIRAAGADLRNLHDRNRPVVLSIAAGFNLLFILMIALILRYWNHHTLAVLGLTLNVKDICFLIIAFVFMLGLAIFFIFFLQRREMVQISKIRRSFGNAGAGIWISVIVLFIAALQEEFLFRGYFAFVLLPFGFYVGLLVSAAVFTLWHFLTNSVHLFQVVDWFVGGLLLFLIYYLSGSIWVVALVHVGRNLINVFVFGISASNSLIEYKRPIAPPQKTLYTISSSFAVALTGLFLYHSSSSLIQY
ncbi:MAG: CPBP family intramembrane metalloprotease [Saprospiraceae bacterium]|nr:CPBP family intramembrane metalloprotease [Saprospiraceae bacterium]